MQVAGHDKELWVSAEALDVIIDLYSDDKTDKLAQQVHLVDTLKEIQPQFKSKVSVHVRLFLSECAKKKMFISEQT